MSKLNQIIAIEKGVKTRVYSELSQLNGIVQKQDPFQGFVKTYERLHEDGEELPGESKKVKYSAETILKRVNKQLSELMGITARKDWSNNQATADIVVDGQTVVADAPVTYLLFLEKQLNDVHKLVANMPTLNRDDDWSEDPNTGMFRTAPLSTHRTRKVQKPIVLYDATDKHPAQTQLITEDELAGHWRTVKQSGALPEPRKEKLLERVEKLVRAVKEAREAANDIDEVATPDVGAALFDYILAP